MQATRLGERLKRRRQEMGISLRELARRTDLTASFLSQVENAKANLSLDSLRRIAGTLEVPLFYFLSEVSDVSNEEVVRISNHLNNMESVSDVPRYSPVVRSDIRPKLFLPSSGVTYEMLTPDMGRKMEAFCGRLSPGTGNVARKLRESTEEFIYVLSGSLMVGLNYGDFLLNAGDSIYFEGDKLNNLVCASDQEVSWISVITPSVF